MNLKKYFNARGNNYQVFSPKESFGHPVYNIGLQDIRNAWLLNKPPMKLTTTTYRGNLIFLPIAIGTGSGKLISYRTLKKGLVKKTIVLSFPVKLLPF
jgi:hypothetical protein